MKILYLRLKNSIGIFAGTNKREIEIDFNKNSKNDIVMIFGANGSGKSTLLSSLNPFTSSTNDERDKFFIPNEEGEKEIHYKIDDMVYIINHYITAKNKTKSFFGTISYDDYIKLNPKKVIKSSKYKELNDNGGVITFKELIKEYFDVDEDFFKISRIGSNVVNFIDLTPSNRKKFISNFLPDIDEYLRRYKIVNDKYRYFTKEIKYIADEITKLGDKEDLNKKYKSIESKLSSVENEIVTKNKKVAEAEGKINILDVDSKLSSNNYKNYLEPEYNKAKKEYEDIEDYEEIKIDEINDKLIKVNEKLTKLKIDEATSSSNISNIKETISNLTNDIRKKESEKDNLNFDDYKKLVKERNDYNTKLLSLNNILKTFKSSEINFTKLNKIDVNDINLYLILFNELKEIIINFKSYEYPELIKMVKDIISGKSNLNKYKTNVANLKVNLEEHRKILQKLNSDLVVETNNLQYIEILKQRPSTCKEDDCPFISNALKHKDVESKIKTINEKITAKEESITKLQKLIEQIEAQVTLIQSVELFYNSNTEFVKNIPLTHFDKVTNLETLLNLIISESITTLSKLSLKQVAEYKNIVIEIKNIENNIKLLDKSLRTYKNIENIVSNIDNDINENQTKLNEANKKYLGLVSDKNIINEKITKYNKTITKLNEAVDIINSISKKKEAFEKVSKEYNNVESTISTINNLLNIKNSNENDIEGLNDIKKDLTIELDDLKFKINKLKEFTNRKKIVDDVYLKLGYIKEALSATKGIPVYFSKNYLNITKDITNKLLDISQNGKFLIDFDINDKEFLIKVYKDNGDTLNDIKYASQGETALTSLSLSLALIEQSISKYNIFLLDELDGALDDNNRKSFIDMVSNQMSKLSSEQVFIISHNKEFDSYPLDLILLNGNNIDTEDKEFMMNKNIVYSV